MSKRIIMGNFSFSIIIPVYGVELFIEECCRSLFSQDYDNVEYIFIDDFSPDNSVEIIRTLAEEYCINENVKVIRHSYNRGVAAARNTGLDNVSGDYILFVDPDDYVEKDMLYKINVFLKKYQCDICSFGYYAHKGESVTIIHKPDSHNLDVYKVLSRDKNTELWSNVYKTSLFEGVRCIEGYNLGEDWLLLCQLYEKSQNNAIIKDALYHYRIASNANAYTFCFNESKYLSVIGNLDEIERIFFTKGDKYKESFYIGACRILSQQIFNSCQKEEYAEIYKDARKRFSKIPSDYYNFVGKRFKITLYIHNKIALRACVFLYLFLSKISKILKST